MLAWLRTGVTIMAFGFVIARFGLFLRLLQLQTGQGAGQGASPYIGSALVGLGAATIAGGVIGYRRFCRTIPRADRPEGWSYRFVLLLSWALVTMGIVLTAVLLLG